MTDYYILNFLPSIQRWVVLDPTGEIVASRVTYEAAQTDLNRLNNQKEQSCHSVK